MNIDKYFMRAYYLYSKTTRSYVMKNGIENIIFDLGGVLYKLNYDATSQEFKKLGAVNFDSLYSQHQQSDLFDKFETGKITPQQFCDQLKIELDIAYRSNEEIINAWNAMLLEFPKEHVELLISLKNKYQIFLFSNTNAIHMDYFSTQFKDAYGYDIKDLFDEAYFSCECGFKKPAPESFQNILSKHNLIAENTFFIDDTRRHIDGANQTGLHTKFLEKGMSVLDIEKYILDVNENLLNKDEVNSTLQLNRRLA